MIYHSIGDSNCLYNTYHLPRFVQHHLGSVRMRDIADRIDRGFGLLDIRRLGVVPGDKCFFTAGAIDVRCDIHNQIIAGEDEAELIAELVARYLEVLRQNEIPGVKFWLVAVLPTAYSAQLPEKIRDDPSYPYTGGDDEITRYTLRMNAELLLQGTIAGYQYLDIFHRYADENNLLRPELGIYMHVSDNKPILAEMHARGLYTDEEAGAEPGLAATIKAMRECPTA